MNPFVALVIDRDVGDIVDGDSDIFKGKVRSGAVPVARQPKLSKKKIDKR
ncbi:hypothetical protein [Sinorhizobium meliloti]|nr:hypothetical protein [Sinorhizobium meliloti]MQW58888.1 hypothetical protein [Sinorhizobium meliloti]